MSKKFLADTAGLDVNEGDMVLIGETRPVSKNKRFKVIEVIGKKEIAGMSVEEEMRETTQQDDETTTSTTS